MLDQHLQQIHQHDREEHAQRLGLSLEKFDELLASANQAYEVIKELGPFYGREDIAEPTFRITAEPVKLPQGSEKLLKEFGNDLLQLARVLPKLPEELKQKLGDDLDFSILPAWRIDAIIDKDGNIKANEIEGVDGASALMMAEQQAYGLQTLHESTAAHLISTLEAMCESKLKTHNKYKVALILTTNWPHTINARKFIKFLHILSKDTIEIDLFDTDSLAHGTIKPDWTKYAGVMNERGFAPEDLEKLGIKPEQILTSGNYNAICRKGVYPLVFDESLKAFWIEQLGEERFGRIKAALIPSKFIRTVEDFEEARQKGQVVKVAWANENAELIHRSKGVAVPVGETEHGSEERWETLKTVLRSGDATLIAQDFVEPALTNAFLRKKGTTLEPVEWYNRLCVKYVVEGNPNDESTTNVSLTAAEVTLGPHVIPTGRACAFTAGKLQ